MAQSADLTAYKAALASDKGRKKKNTYYFPIGRTITTIGGVLRMVNPGNLQAGIEHLINGRLAPAADRLGKVFDGGQIKEGASVVAAGIVLGKVLDKTKTNPRLALGKFGIKLV